MRVLAIDTAGPVVAVAALEGDVPVFEWSERIARGADGVLLPAVARALQALVAVDLVAVTVGPGAFTGLRVGVAAALGVAVGREVMVAPVSSLAARACLAPGDPCVLSLLDARKGRVYAGIYDTTSTVPKLVGVERDEILEAVVPAQAFRAVGEGAIVFGAGVRAAGGSVVDHADAPTGAHVARLGRDGIARMRPEDIALRYLRNADAVPRARD